MKGKHRITVQNKKIKYAFEIKRNITVIQGDSATGKTALVAMIREYYENGKDSGIELKCDKTCMVLEGKNWELQLSVILDSIVFIDEGNDFVSSKAFASAIAATDNYYVLVTREGLETLPYSVNEIYGIRNSGKYGYLKQTYNEMYQIYPTGMFHKKVRPEHVITEDSNAGFQYFDYICRENDITCEAANGKSNIFRLLLENQRENLLVIADGAAFGSEMVKIMQILKRNNLITLYLPESFEWIILESGAIQDSELLQILSQPYDFVESKEFFSWERYFTYLLIERTANTFMQYTKRNLNEAYLHKAVSDKLLKVMGTIDFQWKSRG